MGIDTRAPHLVSSYQTLEGDLVRSDISSLVYNRLQEDALSDKNSMVSGGASVVYARTGHPVSMTGSLSRYRNLPNGFIRLENLPSGDAFIVF